MFSRMLIASSMQRLHPDWSSAPRYFTSTTGPLYFKMSAILQAEPIKKKKKADPALIKARFDRKLRRVDKHIRYLRKAQQQLKPINEIELPIKIIAEKIIRARIDATVTEEELHRRFDLADRWSLYKSNQCREEHRIISLAIEAQDKAMEELKVENEELWFAAVQINITDLPFRRQGPTDTPPIENYDSYEGDFVDKTRTWTWTPEAKAEFYRTSSISMSKNRKNKSQK